MNRILERSYIIQLADATDDIDVYEETNLESKTMITETEHTETEKQS